MVGIEEELQGTHYRELKPYSKVPSSSVAAALMLLPLLLSLQPRPQQHNSDNHTTTATTLDAIPSVKVISSVVIIFFPIVLRELTIWLNLRDFPEAKKHGNYNLAERLRMKPEIYHMAWTATPMPKSRRIYRYQNGLSTDIWTSFLLENKTPLKKL